jgi:hypothetical protein
VAVKVAVVLPDPTVTEAGTVSAPTLLDSPTVAPPVFDTVTVQVELAPDPRLPGVQVNELRVGGDGIKAVTVLATPLMGRLFPPALAPSVSVTSIVVLATPDAIVTLTTATTPFCITLAFNPASRQK